MQVLLLAWIREKRINTKTGDTARKAADFTEKILNINCVLLPSCNTLSSLQQRH